MTATNPKDKQLVRMLLLKHLPSGFPQPLEPLDVQGVACHISSQWRWRQLVFKWEAPILDRLIHDQTPLPVELTADTITALLTDAGVTDPGGFAGLFLPSPY